MTSTYETTLRPRLRRLVLPLFEGPSGELARAALPATFGVAGLAAVLPGSGLVSSLLAVAVFCGASVVATIAAARHYPHDQLGLCNYVTLLRLMLVSALMAPLFAGGHLSWAYFAVASIALAFDGVDGWLARRQGRVSAFGARFDVETDSALALVLAANAALATGLGWMVLILGLPRYAFAVAVVFLPWMRRDLPERFSRKVVCVLQIAALIALQAPLLPPFVATVMVAAIAALLVWSFTRDIFWLSRQRG